MRYGVVFRYVIGERDMDNLHELTPDEKMAVSKIISSPRMISAIIKSGGQRLLAEMKAFQAVTPDEEIQFYPPRGLFDGLDLTDTPNFNFISSSIMTEMVIKSRRCRQGFLEWFRANLLRQDRTQVEFYEVERPLMARWRNTIVYHPALVSELVRQVKELIDAVMGMWEQNNKMEGMKDEGPDG